MAGCGPRALRRSPTGNLSFASDHVSWVEAEYICDIVVAPGPSVRVSGGYATFLFRLTGMVSSTSNSVATYGEGGCEGQLHGRHPLPAVHQLASAGYLVSVPMLITFSEATPIAAKLTSFVEITNLTRRERHCGFLAYVHLRRA